jgi:CRP-like cAMP-binding protein
LQELSELAETCEAREFLAGEVLMAPGDRADFFGVVVAGQLKAAIPGNERPAAAQVSAPPLLEWRLMATGSVVGEMALFSGHQRTAHVEAVTDGTLVVIRCTPAGCTHARTPQHTLQH